MRQMIVLLLSSMVVIAISIMVESCIVRKSEPITARQFVPADERIANGERVYMIHCQKCHPGGEGGLGPAINPNPAPGFIKRFQMRHGLGVMPAFKKTEISEQDLKDISSYMHAWKHY